MSTAQSKTYEGPMSTFEIKDSGRREIYNSGMERDISDGKIDYTLIFDGPMLERWAAHLTKGAHKYSKRNWMKAKGQEELFRFRESALRHFVQWFRGDTDEDHASAVFFNMNGAEYTLQRGEDPPVVPDKEDDPGEGMPWKSPIVWG